MTLHMSTVYLSLGSNMGNRLHALRRAIHELDKIPEIHVYYQSSVYETEPWGLTGQKKFLNIVVEIETALTPLELLDAVKDLEKRLGRLPSTRWGPRCIDIDLILWDATVICTPRLTLPHKHFRERAFVLQPLAEIAPDVIDPETGCTISELSARIPNTGISRYTASTDS